MNNKANGALTAGWLQTFLGVGVAIVLAILGGVFYLGNALGTVTTELNHINRALDSQASALGKLQDGIAGLDKHLDKIEARLEYAKK